jgi:hypothetical protein
MLVTSMREKEDREDRVASIESDDMERILDAHGGNRGD